MSRTLIFWRLKDKQSKQRCLIRFLHLSLMGGSARSTLCRPAQHGLLSSDALPPQKLKSRSQFLSKQKSSCFSFLLTYFGTVPKYSSSIGGVARTCQSACPVLTALDPPSPSPARLSPVPFQSLPRLVRTPSLAPPDSSIRFQGKTVSSSPEAPRTPSRFSRSPGVIVLAPHVYGLVQVAFGGRFLTRALHRDEGGAATDA